MARKTQYVVLCEDEVQYSFARRFLIGRGAHPRRFSARYSPRGRGSGEQWVRDHFAEEVAALRRYGGSRRSLVVLIDADTLERDQRIAELLERLRQEAMVDLHASERIGVFVPARNIETWIHHILNPGRADLDEKEDYSASRLPDGWRQKVENYAKERATKPKTAPDSFRQAARAYERIKP